MKDDNKKFDKLFWISRNKYGSFMITKKEPDIDKNGLWSYSFYSNNDYIMNDMIIIVHDNLELLAGQKKRIEIREILKKKNKDPILVFFAQTISGASANDLELETNRMYYVYERRQ